MRHIGAAGAIFVVVLLIGYVEAPCELPPLPPIASNFALEVRAGNEPAPRKSIPTIPAVTEMPRPRQSERLETVRHLAKRLGTPSCGSNLIIDDETGQPLPGQEPWEIKEFRQLGEGAVADCAFILADPNSTWEEITGVGEIAIAFKTGRRFVPLVVQRIAAPDAMLAGDASLDHKRELIRWNCIVTLEKIGDERDAWVLIHALHHGGVRSQRSAVETLAVIGGQRELDALNAWLVVQNPNDPRVATYRKYRDQFETRLRNHPSKWQL